MRLQFCFVFVCVDVLVGVVVGFDLREGEFVVVVVLDFGECDYDFFVGGQWFFLGDGVFGYCYVFDGCVEVCCVLVGIVEYFVEVEYDFVFGGVDVVVVDEFYLVGDDVVRMWIGGM